MFRVLAPLLAAAFLASCGQQSCGPSTPAGAPAADSGWVTDLTVWKKQDTGPSASVEIRADLPETNPDPQAVPFPPVPDDVRKAGVLVLGQAEPFSVVRYEGPREIPVDDYEVSWEAMRLDGNDFFATLTFPVGNKETCASFVTGGWGGMLTGVSCIDHIFASENSTTSSFNFKNGRWYRFSLQVNRTALRATCNGEQLFHVSIKDRQISMHPSDIRKCMPLGFSSYQTEGAIRHIRIRRLANGDLLPPKDDY